jgi:hypothetical protein
LFGSESNFVVNIFLVVHDQRGTLGRSSVPKPLLVRHEQSNDGSIKYTVKGMAKGAMQAQYCLQTITIDEHLSNELCLGEVRCAFKAHISKIFVIVACKYTKNYRHNQFCG